MSILTAAEYQTYTGTSLDATQLAYVTNIIPVIQDQIEVYIDRLIDAQDYYEWYSYDGCIFLNQYPVNTTKFVGNVVNVASFDITDYTYEIIGNSETGAVAGLLITDDALTTTTFTFGGGVDTLTNIKTAVESAIPAITMTIESGYETMSYKLLRLGTGLSVYGATRIDAPTVIEDNRTLSFMLYPAFNFTSDIGIGAVQSLFVVYNAGWATADVPPDLKMIAANMIKDVLNIQGMGGVGGVSGLFQSESITNYSYSLGAGATGFTTVNIASIVQKYYGDLEPYRKKVV